MQFAKVIYWLGRAVYAGVKAMSLHHGPTPQEPLAALAGFNARQLYRNRIVELERDPCVTQEMVEDFMATPGIGPNPRAIEEATANTVYWTRKRLKKALLAELNDPEVIQYESQPGNS